MLPVVLFGVVVVLLLKASSPTKADPCDQLGDAKAVLACKAARGVVGAAYDALRDAVQGEDVHIANVAINGATTEWWDDEPGWQAASAHFGAYKATLRTFPENGLTGPRGQSHPKRHENGCVPLPGHPDFGKCGAGTRSMASTGVTYNNMVRAGRGATEYRGVSYPAVAGRPAVHPDALGSGDPQRDALSFPWDQRLTPAVQEGGPQGPVRALDFPDDVPEGATAWVVRGDAHVCPPGTEVRGRDHRTGAETRSPCSAVNTVDAPPEVPPGADEPSSCLNYWTADGRNVRDCREGATLPPGASTTPPVGRAGTARVGGTSSTGFYV